MHDTLAAALCALEVGQPNRQARIHFLRTKLREEHLGATADELLRAVATSMKIGIELCYSTVGDPAMVYGDTPASPYRQKISVLQPAGQGERFAILLLVNFVTEELLTELELHCLDGDIVPAPAMPQWIIPAWTDIPNWLPRFESTVYYGLSHGKRILDHAKALRASTLAELSFRYSHLSRCASKFASCNFAGVCVHGGCFCCPAHQ